MIPNVDRAASLQFISWVSGSIVLVGSIYAGDCAVSGVFDQDWVMAVEFQTVPDVSGSCTVLCGLPQFGAPNDILVTGTMFDLYDNHILVATGVITDVP